MRRVLGRQADSRLIGILLLNLNQKIAMENMNSLTLPGSLRFVLHDFRDYECSVKWVPWARVLTYTIEQYRPQRRTTVEDISPSRQDWMDFEKSLEIHRVWKWANDYCVHNVDIISYSLEIGWQGKQLRSVGRNKLPFEFNQFRNALSTLCGGRVIGRPWCTVGVTIR